MIVYVDLIFLLNLLINSATLQTTSWVRRMKPKRWRILLAAVIGASYVLMMFFPALSFLFTFIVKGMFSMVMVWTAFGFGSLQHFLRNLAVFYMVNFAVAGGIFAVHYFLQSSHEVWNGILYTQSGGIRFEFKVGALFILMTFPMMIWFYRKIVRSGERREELTSYLAETMVHIDDHLVHCTGLIDTGNQLYDPLTRTPVMVMEVSRWSDVLPNSWVDQIQHADSDQILSAVGNEDFVWEDRLRFIPYRGIQRNSSFMLALKPDKVVITHNEHTFETSKVLIGLKGEKLSSDGSYQAIIHPTMTNMHGR